MVTMKGELITLEPLDIKRHVKGYFEISQDERIHEYVCNAVPKDISETEELLKKYELYFLNWMILSNESQSVIGIIRLGKPEAQNGVLIAGESQFLSSKYWRKGHMKEAKKLFYEYVFNELSIETLYADVWDGNINSMKSLESYGYQLIETYKEVFKKTGKHRLKLIYSLNRKDYYLNLKNRNLKTD